MIVSDKEALFARIFDRAVDAFGCVTAEKRLFILIKLYLILVFRCIAEKIAFIPVGLLALLGCLGNEANVTGFRHGAVLIKIEFHFEARQSEKFLIRQIMMRNHNIVIGIRNDRIAAFRVFLFELLRCPAAVGNRGMAMQIGFVKLTAFGKKKLFHKQNLS